MENAKTESNKNEHPIINEMSKKNNKNSISVNDNIKDSKINLTSNPVKKKKKRKKHMIFLNLKLENKSKNHLSKQYQ
jgi:hypothetical protein